jgi:hypothetical protein
MLVPYKIKFSLKQNKVGDRGQVVEFLASNHKALSSIPALPKKKSWNVPSPISIGGKHNSQKVSPANDHGSSKTF